MNRCNVYVAGICVEVIASYLISIPQSQIVSAGYRHQKILICNTIQNHSIDFLHTLRIRSGVQFCENFRILKESRELAEDRITHSARSHIAHICCRVKGTASSIVEGQIIFASHQGSIPGVHVYCINNMAIGMYAGNSGNALYCPTGYLELLCLQDRFVYLPEMPYRKVDLDKAARNVLTQEQFEQDGGDGTVASWRNTVTVENVHPNTTVSFRMNNLSGSAAELKLYAYGADGKLAEVSKELWTITDEAGTGVDTLADGTLYELRVSVADGSAFDLSETEKEIKISVVLAK